MRVGRIPVALAALALAATGALSGCAGKEKVPAIHYLVDAPITSYNASSTLGYFSAARQALGRVLVGATYVGPQGDSVADTDFGSATEVSGDVQTIQYRINPAAVWSDGVPITCEDLVLAWAANSGRYTNGTTPMFDSPARGSYDEIDRVDCQPGSKDASVVFRGKGKVAGWRTLFAAGTVLPAHVATDSVHVGSIATIVQTGDQASLNKVAEFWNTAWALVPGKTDTSKLVSSGPYRVDSFDSDGALVLVANDRWWGRKPATSRVVVYGSNSQLATKAEFDDADVIDARAGYLDDHAPKSMATTVTPTFNTEQLILATSGALAPVPARVALAQCAPRAKLFDELGHPGMGVPPLLGNGVLNSRLVAPTSLYYGPAAAGGAKFPGGDVPAAKATLTGGHIENLHVRVGYAAPDKARARTVAMLSEACAPAGITVEDAGAPDARPTQLGERFDVWLGGTQAAIGPGGQDDVPFAAEQYQSGRGVNIGHFRNPRFDDVAGQLGYVQSEVTELGMITDAENMLWSDMPSIPLFDQPRLTAGRDGMSGLVPNPTLAGAGWNMDRWELQK